MSFEDGWDDVYVGRVLQEPVGLQLYVTPRYVRLVTSRAPDFLTHSLRSLRSHPVSEPGPLSFLRSK